VDPAHPARHEAIISKAISNAVVVCIDRLTFVKRSALNDISQPA
jgi:hypothetical protein